MRRKSGMTCNVAVWLLICVFGTMPCAHAGRGGPSQDDTVGYDWLDQVPAWMPDKAPLSSRYDPDPDAPIAHAETLIRDWQAYWKRIKSESQFSSSTESGDLPRLTGAPKVSTDATLNYNFAVTPYSPANVKGVICFTPKGFIGDHGGANFGKEVSVMANCWKETFARGRQGIDPHFVYTVPGKSLAPDITVPTGIKGASTVIPVTDWPESKVNHKTRQTIINESMEAVLDTAIKAVYR